MSAESKFTEEGDELLPNPDGSKTSAGRILAVDDDEVTLGILRELLEMTGFEVVTAGSGQEAVELFESDGPHLVITDIRMPGMDGLEVLHTVRELDDTVPVILVTGFGDLDNAIGALRRGAYDFLQKPINAEILLNTVRQGLEHYRLRRFERDYTRVLEEQVKERTKELARTNEFLQRILDSSTGVSIVLTDFDKRVVFWNTGAEKIFGYNANEMIGSKITRLYPSGDAPPGTLTALDEMTKDRQGTVQGKVKQVSKDGRELTISLAVSPMYDSSGNVGGILGLGQDVTEEVRLHEELLESYKQIKRIQGTSVFALAKLVESRDGETSFHLRRMQEYCAILCERLRTKEKYAEVLTERFVDDLVQSSVLHDIGKVAIPDSVLFNPRKFGIEEYEIMKQHALFGGRALEEAAEEAGEESFLSLGRDIAYYHHERWDGKGYPFGLVGEEIPLAARIVSIADVYDALTTERRYKKAFTHEESRAVIAQNRGKQFDPEIVDAFMEVQGEFRKIREKELAKGAPLQLEEMPVSEPDARKLLGPAPSGSASR